LYLRFTLSYRDVEELLAERGIDVSYETVCCWVLKLGPRPPRRETIEECGFSACRVSYLDSAVTG